MCEECRERNILLTVGSMNACNKGGVPAWIWFSRPVGIIEGCVFYYQVITLYPDQPITHHPALSSSRPPFRPTDPPVVIHTTLFARPDIPDRAAINTYK